MKILRRIVNIIIWTAVSVYLLTLLLFRLPPVQSALASATAGALSSKIGSEVSVGKIDVGMFNRIIVDELEVRDLNDSLMLRSARLAVKVHLGELLHGRIRITSAQMFSTNVSLYQDNDSSELNCQFIIDAFTSSDSLKTSRPLDLAISSFMMRHGSLTFDKRDKEESAGKFNPSHLRLDDISAYMQLPALTGDTLVINLKKLALAEQSGIKVDNVSLSLTAGLSGASLSDFELCLPHSKVRVDEVETKWDLQGKRDSTATVVDEMEEPDYTWNFKKLVPTIFYKAMLGKSSIRLADLSPLLPTLSKFTDQIDFSASLSGTGKSLTVERLWLTSPAGDIGISLSGWAEKREPYTAFNVSIDNIEASAKTVSFFYDNLKGRDISLPEALVRMGDIRLRGNASGRADGLSSFNGDITTAVGNLSVNVSAIPLDADDCSQPRSVSFSGRLISDGVNLGDLLANDKLGMCVADISLQGSLPNTGGKPDFRGASVDFNLSTSATVNGYSYDDLRAKGSYNAGDVEGSLSVDDPNLWLSAEGSYALTGDKGSVMLDASLSRFSPMALHLSDRWGEAVFSALITADFSGSNINDSKGTLLISDFSMTSTEDTCLISKIGISSGYNTDNTHFVLMDSDFGKAELSGNFNYSTLAHSFTNLVSSRLPSCPGLPLWSQSADNRFKFSCLLNESHWLQSLFGIDLVIDKPVEMWGFVDDAEDNIGIRCLVPSIYYNGTLYADGSLTFSTPGDSLRCDASLRRINDKGKSANISLSASAADNTLDTNMAWWGETGNEKVSASIDAHTLMFVDASGRKTATTEIQPSKLKIGDKVWDVASKGIVYRKKRIEVGGLSVSSGDQYALVSGVASDSPVDTLLTSLKGIEIGYILDLINFHSVEFTGKASGNAFLVAPFGEMRAWTSVTVDDFLFEGGRMGVLTANVGWNAAEKQIDLKGVCDDGDAKTYIDGYVAPSRKWLDIDFEADGTYLDFLLGFTSSFISKIDGHTWGKLKLSGPTGSLDLVGECVVDAKLLIGPINCEYTINKDTLYFVPNEIEFHHAPLFDKDGNRGFVDGQLHHQHLKNLSYDLNVTAENLLAYDFKDFGEDVFYGTVYGTGEMGIHGVSGRMEMDINVTPGKNSSITYNVASAEEVDTYQDYIVWHDVTNRTDTTGVPSSPASASPVSDAMPPQAIVETTTDMRLNFLIDMTPDATVRLLMDPRTNDYITLHGDGVIRATYHNKGAFNLFGTYRVIDGTYGITIQEIIKKNFTFTEGSSIVFGGNPFDANLNLQASYTVNGVSLSDLSIGNSYSGNTIRVNCLMNIGGVAQNPQITFDLDMPTVSTDEKQMIKSLINSEEEMNQQVIYLLGIGRFYPQGNNAAQSGKEQSETSMAVNSFLSGTLSSQINQLLGSVIKSDNWSFGANISTGDEGWNNAEYEGLISGSMLNNRLLFNGQFGYRDNVATNNTSFIGDFDLRYLLIPNGNLALKVYNQSNDRYFTKSSLNTQGVGLIMKKDFTNFWEMLGWGKKKNNEEETDEKKTDEGDKTDEKE